MTQKILVIRFSSIGDIVLTTPVIRALHRQLGAEVHFLTKEAFAPIVHFNPHIAKVIILAEDFDSMTEALKAEQYDHIIDLHHNVRTQRIRFAVGSPFTSFRKLNFEKWLLVRFGINRLPDSHIVDRYLATAASLGVVKDDEGLDFFVPAEKSVDIKGLWNLLPGQYISFVIGAAHQTKCLTPIQIAQVCDQLPLPVVLLGGHHEKEKALAVVNASSHHTIINSCGTLDILQSASVIQQSGPIITHDTGLMHITAALKKPQVVVWGNTIPEFGMYPYYGNHKVSWISMEQKNLSCRPCSKLGFDKCPKGHFKCIMHHHPDQIAAAAMSLYNEYPNPLTPLIPSP